MLKKIKSLFKKETIDESKNEEFSVVVSEIIAEIKENSDDFNFLIYHTKFSELASYAKFKKKEISFKRGFALWLIEDIVRIYKNNGSVRLHNLRLEGEAFSVERELLPLVFRSNLGFEESDFMHCFNFFNKKTFIYKLSLIHI